MATLRARHWRVSRSVDRRKRIDKHIDRENDLAVRTFIKSHITSDSAHYYLIPVVPAIADGGMINTNRADHLAVGKTVEAIVDCISIHF